MEQLWETELTSEEEERLIEKFAQEVGKRKLEAPATLMLEMHKPLAYFGASAMVAFSPFIIPFMGFNSFNDYSRLLSKRENWDRLIAALEAASESREGAA